MQMNTPSDTPKSSEDINNIVKAYMKYLAENPYGAVEAEIHGSPCTVIAAVDSKEMEQVQPMFIIPSPELVLSIVNPEDKNPIFGIVQSHLN